MAAANKFENLTARNMTNSAVSSLETAFQPTAITRKTSAEKPNPYSWRVRSSVVRSIQTERRAAGNVTEMERTFCQ